MLSRQFCIVSTIDQRNDGSVSMARHHSSSPLRFVRGA
jgi:hypothetical protein